MPEVVVALGANMGDPAQQVIIAMARLGDIAEGAVTRSSLWQSAPDGMNDASGAFINAVVVFDTVLESGALLAALQAIEVEMGRPVDHGKNVARMIDLDLVAYGDELINEPWLEVPHPRLAERLFVLLPLAEIRPEFRRPGDGQRIDVLVKAAPVLKISRL
ncbi:MAG: 2-amino-4-hydroxy-6-hydroxymethyldihydropteridine diphosphokinase [Candidatus Azotimanducaceae bacterium]